MSNPVPAYPKRLIEVDLPIARISAHARREKSIRHGHISTLHIWWARRPLGACRAVICASLWPDPADDQCPTRFRKDAFRILSGLRSDVLNGGLSPDQRTATDFVARITVPKDEGDLTGLRTALLDFIAEFANWDLSTNKFFLAASRALTQSAHESLGGHPETRPLVFDPFAGGGSIPLEALRVNADVFASDLNPVPVLLNKVLLEYVPKYGQRLAEAVNHWGAWIQREAENELTEYYPRDTDGPTPIAYLWARTALSEAPGEGDVPVEIPLITTFWLSTKKNRKVALRWARDAKGEVQTSTVKRTYADGSARTVRQPLLEIFEPKKDSEVPEGTCQRSSATCPISGFTVPAPRVRQQFAGRKGGATDARLIAVVTKRDGEDFRSYRSPTQHDYDALKKADDALASQIRAHTKSHRTKP